MPRELPELILRLSVCLAALTTTTGCGPDTAHAVMPQRSQEPIAVRRTEVTTRWGGDLAGAIAPDEGLATLFATVVAQPDAREPRKALAAAYSSHGVPAAALFYQKSTESTLEHAGSIYERPSTGAICNRSTADIPLAALEVGRRIHPAVAVTTSVADSLRARRGELRQIVDQTRDSTDCYLLAEWADAVMELTTYSHATTPQERERAVRVLLMMSDDGGLLPYAYESSADVFLALSRYFAEIGDLHDARFAVLVAQDRLRNATVDDAVRRATQQSLSVWSSRLAGMKQSER